MEDTEQDNQCHFSYSFSSNSSEALQEGKDFDDDVKALESLRDSSSLSISSSSRHPSEESGKPFNGFHDIVKQEHNTDYEDDQRTSCTNMRSGNGRMNLRTDHSRYLEHRMQRKATSNPSGMTDDEDVETLNETSYEDATFNTSLCSDRGNGSSSELSVDPVVWKKFKFLSSILKVGSLNMVSHF